MIEKLKFMKLSPSAVLPTRGSVHAAGVDLYSAESIRISNGHRAAVKTGIAVAIPHGFYGRIAPRSGLALKFGINVLAGVVDSDYRGELICVLINHGDEAFTIDCGERIAQLIIEQIITPEPEWAPQLEATSRAEGGFGSTDT